jgi:hypothetical protein
MSGWVGLAFARGGVTLLHGWIVGVLVGDVEAKEDREEAACLVRTELGLDAA